MISQTLILLIILLSGILFYKLILIPRKYWKNKGVTQASSLWVFGETWKTLLQQESFIESLIRIYNTFPNLRYFGTYQFNTPVFVVRDIDLIKQICIKDFDHFVDHRSILPESVDPLWGNNLFSLKGQKWREMRIILSPAFTTSKMKNMFKLMNDTAINFIQYFEEKQEDSIELNFKDIFYRYTCDVIATTAFGIETNSLKFPKNEFHEVGREFTNFTGWRSLLFVIVFALPEYILKLLGVRIFSEKVTKFFISVINETIETRKAKGIVRPDMIHLLMQARKGYQEAEDETIIDTGYATAKTSSYFANKNMGNVDISNKDIAAQAAVFFFGGFDSVSSEMRFLVCELAVNPDIQHKLREEINTTYENFNGNITYEAIMKMDYMDMVVSEILRKYPNGPMLERICSKPYNIPAKHRNEKDIVLEKGSLIWIPVVGLHYDPGYFPNPEKFYPERFSTENRSTINPQAYIPFGSGPRNCIGSRFALMEIKVIFFHLLRKFEIIPVEKSQMPVRFSRKSFTVDGNCFWYGLRKLKPN